MATQQGMVDDVVVGAHDEEVPTQVAPVDVEMASAGVAGGQAQPTLGDEEAYRRLRQAAKILATGAIRAALATKRDAASPSPA